MRREFASQFGMPRGLIMDDNDFDIYKAVSDEMFKGVPINEIPNRRERSRARRRLKRGVPRYLVESSLREAIRTRVEESRRKTAKQALFGAMYGMAPGKIKDFCDAASPRGDYASAEIRTMMWATGGLVTPRSSFRINNPA